MNFEQDYLSKLGLRATGFHEIFRLLRKRYHEKGPLMIVETGCVRDAQSWEGDGNSTVMFNAFAHETGSRFISIDIESKHCALAKQLCPHTEVLCENSIPALFALKGHLELIDFLYLDSFDLDWNNPHPSALHHLKELCAAMPLLDSASIVFVDDNRNGIGKGQYVSAFMKEIGATLVYDGYQIGFILP